MNKIYKPSFFRILTNSTFNCLMFVLLILVGIDLFRPGIEKYIFITACGIEITVALAIILYTIKEYKFSYLAIDKNGITQILASSKKKTVSIPYESIKEVKVESFSLKIYYEDKKLTIDYFKEYKEIAELLQKKMEK